MLRRTLTNGRSAMLTAMFSEALPLISSADGRVFIDRDGERFGTVLSFLRTGACPELPASGAELAKLLDEAEFYQARRLLLAQPSSTQFAFLPIANRELLSRVPSVSRLCQ